MPITGILSRTAKRKRPLLTVELVLYGGIDEETERATRTKNRSFKGLSQLKHGWFSFDSEHMLFDKWKEKLLTIDYDALEKLLKQPPTDAEKKEHLRDFVEMALLLKKNDDLKQYFEHHGESYVSGILIIKTEIH